MKKAQGLSFNTIIIAVLALTVLVILFYIFNSNVGKSAQGISSCTGKQGMCAVDMRNQQCGDDKPIGIRVADCKNTDPRLDGLCCIPLGVS